MEIYQNANPFPHLVIDQLFAPKMLDQVVQAFPPPSDGKWWKYDNVLEKKLARDRHSEFPPDIRDIVHELMENEFVSFLEKLTGIEGLIVDHTLRGGGLHQILPGGKLDVHADYNYHPVTKLDRRLNVIVYLNPIWCPEWNGQLELWNEDMTQCVTKIEPKFNRTVIFSTTDTAYHGHPEPLACPEGITRKSIALYYYSNGRPDSERTAPHSTIFKKRPQDQDDPEADALRAKRAQGRLKDQST